jgi:hypothetical protein
MLLKQLSLSGSGIPAIQYLYRLTRPLLQFLLQKLAERISKILGDRLNLPAGAGSNDDWRAQQLNLILQRCLLPDRTGQNLHTFHTVEFESDLYHGIRRACCYPFDVQQHLFRGLYVKVSLFILFICLLYTWYTPKINSTPNCISILDLNSELAEEYRCGLDILCLGTSKLKKTDI